MRGVSCGNLHLMKRVILILSASAVAGCAQIAPWAVRYQQWAPYDRYGISIAQGDLECDEEAEDSTTNIGGFADRVLSFDQIKAKCLRLRGY